MAEAAQNIQVTYMSQKQLYVVDGNGSKINWKLVWISNKGLHPII